MEPRFSDVLELLGFLQLLKSDVDLSVGFFGCPLAPNRCLPNAHETFLFGVLGSRFFGSHLDRLVPELVDAPDDVARSYVLVEPALEAEQSPCETRLRQADEHQRLIGVNPTQMRYKFFHTCHL